MARISQRVADLEWHNTCLRSELEALSQRYTERFSHMRHLNANLTAKLTAVGRMKEKIEIENQALRERNGKAWADSEALFQKWKDAAIRAANWERSAKDRRDRSCILLFALVVTWLGILAHLFA